MVPIGGHTSGFKGVIAYLVGVGVKSNGAKTVVIFYDGACKSAEHWCVVSMTDTEAIDADDCCGG